MNNTEKMLIGTALFLTWGILVANHMAPVPDFVDFIKATLAGIGLYHVTLKNPKE